MSFVKLMYVLGDFGLSRGLDLTQDDTDQNDSKQKELTNPGELGENTVGVGTRSYASPEQLSGRKDYGSSSDIYSLGIILFEFCYPMGTGMERANVFRGIKNPNISFPPLWHETVAKQFNIVHDLIVSMLSYDPNKRPSAAEVFSRIESLLGEYTVSSLDKKSYQEGHILLRIEAKENDGVLQRTIQLIKDFSIHVKVAQYSLRGQDEKAIMEFALDIQDIELTEDDIVRKVEYLIQSLEKSDEVINVRRIFKDKATQRTLSM